jgi:hypothetical protein
MAQLDLSNVNLNDPTTNKLFTQAGGSSKYALTMGEGIDPATGESYGSVTGGKGSVAIPWIITGSFDALPEEVKTALGVTKDTVYNPFLQTTGYAIDPKTGQYILRTGEGGSSFPTAFAKGVGTGTTSQLTSNMSSGGSTSDLPDGVTVVSTYADPTTGDVTAVLSNGTTKVLAKSGADTAEKKSAYALLYQQFNDLGIGGLVPELETLIKEGVSPAEFTLRLRGTEAYKKRFAGNAQRINKGLRALSEAEYIGLEDQYQNVMRQYGLPESYYTRGEMGRQEGFEKFIAGDVSASELEDRIMTAQKRVLNANPEVAQALKTFYPGISQGDILAYTLDPTKAIEDIKRKVTAAEIGGAAARSGLTTNVTDAEYLQRYGVTKESAEQGYGTIAGGLQRGSQLSSIYGQTPYTQATAEQEIFNVPGAQEAKRQRQKITGLEKATFGGQSGLSQGALARDRAGAY